MKTKEIWNKYLAWQKEPYKVAPMSDEEHVCSTCDTKYTGNYCPRCGQAAKIGPHMSLWKTFLLFLDIWGLGNRGMFRTLRDLILRPGYLICDYITGKQYAYFPPFKLLFLLTTFSLLIGHGFNIFREDYIGEFNPFTIETSDTTEAWVFKFFNKISVFASHYPALFELGLMLFIGNFIYLFFRKSKVLGTLSFHEIIIALVYMVDMSLIYTCVFRFVGIHLYLPIILFLLYIFPLQQFSGYSFLKTTARALLALVLGVITGFVLLIVGLIIVMAFKQPEIFN